jgi:hypothetical protein
MVNALRPVDLQNSLRKVLEEDKNVRNQADLVNIEGKPSRTLALSRSFRLQNSGQQQIFSVTEQTQTITKTAVASVNVLQG